MKRSIFWISLVLVLLAALAGVVIWTSPEVPDAPSDGVTTSGDPANISPNTAEPRNVGPAGQPGPVTIPTPPQLREPRAPSGISTREQPTSSAGSGPPARKEETVEAVQRFRNTKIPIKQRINDINRLGRIGDKRSTQILMALGDAEIYVNRYAVEALGQARGLDVRHYLETKLTDPDALILCAAVRSLGKVAGEKAIPELANVLKQNHERADGHDEMVCTAVVKTFEHIGSVRAVPVLSKELARSEKKGWSMEYGSAIIAALKNGDSPDGRKAMADYAARLSARIPDDPMARKYFETKIAETKAASSGE